jgi:hypothetical protein
LIWEQHHVDRRLDPQPCPGHARPTLEKELTCAILDGRIGEGSQLATRDGDEQPVVLDITNRLPQRPSMISGVGAPRA